jgi:hypothetical protein
MDVCERGEAVSGKNAEAGVNGDVWRMLWRVGYLEGVRCPQRSGAWMSAELGWCLTVTCCMKIDVSAWMYFVCGLAVAPSIVGDHFG